MFPEPTPIQNGHPEKLKTVKIKIPDKWIVTRTAQNISIKVKSWKEIEVREGSGLETGVKSECYIYPEGTERPDQWAGGGYEGGDDLSDLAKVGANVKLGGIPKPGTIYVAELVLTLFETDIPAQHMWGPEAGKQYKVDWSESFKWVVPDGHDTNFIPATSQEKNHSSMNSIHSLLSFTF